MSRGPAPARGPLASTSSISSGSRSPSPFGPIETPHYSNTLPRATGGAAHHAGPVKVQPPFLNPMIELVVAVQDCAEYNFEVKLVGPRNQEVGKIQSVHLAALADLPYYVPPPITEVMSITFSGSSGRPVYGVKTTSGVSAACLPAYFEALDSYRQRLENEIGHKGTLGGQGYNSGRGQGGQQGNTIVAPSQPASPSNVETAEVEALKRAGCMCTSPHLEFNSTDNKLRRDHADVMGHYHYSRLDSAGKPIYQKTPHSHVGSHSHTGTSHSGGRPSSVSTVRPPASSSSSTTNLYLFYMANSKQWMIGPTASSATNANFATTKNTLAKCPGDPQTVGQWQRKTTFLHRWKTETSMSMTCELNL